MRSAILNLLLGVLLAVICFKSQAQDSLKFTSLTTRNGLSSNLVNVVLKDSYGWVWFATADGLNRFDGTNFTVYRHHDGDTTSLPVNEILSLCEDKNGILWIGTGGGSLVYYDRIHDTFHRYHGSGVSKKSQTEAILAITSDHLGRLWVAGYNDLRIIDLKTNKTTKPPLKYNGRFVTLGLFEDSKRRMWLGTSVGLFCVNLDKGTSELYTYNEHDKNSIGQGIVKGIAEDRSGKMWFGTRSGLSMLLPEHAGFSNFLNTRVFTIAPDNGNLWLGTEKGLVIFNTRNLTWDSYFPMLRNSYSLSAKWVNSIFIDTTGIYWMGTNGGINKFDRNLALLDVKLTNLFDSQGLGGPNINAFAEQKKGIFFIGTDNSLQLFDSNTGLFKTISIKRQKNAPDNFTILSLKYDKSGNLWIGTLHDGLYIFNATTNNTVHVMASGTDKHISQNDVHVIEEDQKGRIWIGTNGGGIDIYDPKTGKFCNYSQLYNTSPHNLAANNFIRTITPVNGDEMWAGTWGGGLTVFNIITGQTKIFNKAENALPNDLILSVLQDGTGDIWVATNGGGIDKFDAKSARFKPFLEKDGLINDIVYKILQDKSGIFWLSTSRGIMSLNTHSHQTNVYSKQNGVQDSPFIRGSGIASSDGTLFLGGQDGFNYFDPQKLPKRNEISKVALTGLKVDNNTVFAGKNSPIQQQISMAKEIRLAYHQNFSISYTSLNYTDAHQDEYSYLLKNFDKKWNYVGHSSTAYFTNLDPGDYTFMVRASNGRGNWNTEATSITIKVLPPWWRTIYAYIIYVLSIIGIVFYSRYRGITRIKRKFAIEEEKREAKLMHELDVMKINFLTNISHEFRTPISLIMAPVENLMAIQGHENIAKEASAIKRNTRRLLNLVNQLLDFGKMEAHELRLNFSTGDLIAFIKDAANSFEDISERKKIAFEFQTEVESLPAKFDADKMERIIFNLLSNAFKFTSAGGLVSVSLSVNSHPEASIKIVISDSGIGIPKSEQSKIFKKFFQHDTPETILNQGSGIGLSITKEFIELQGGDISVESEPGVGTSFIVELPVVPISETISYLSESSTDSISSTLTISEESEKCNILLVEDNDEFRNYLKENLAINYNVAEATNGKEGWQKVLSWHPDLVVSDISMPVMDGIELCRKIKTDKRTNFMPVILLTALSGEENEVKGLRTEANDYLTKPFNFEILRTKIHNLISLNQLLKHTYSRQIQMIVPEAEIESSDQKLLNDISIFIEETLNDSEFSIGVLSKHLGMSRSTLYNKLFQLTGQAPVDYVRNIKLQKAASLLEKSNYTIREIAFMTGFATPGYFSKLFKEKYNMSPSEFLTLKRGKPTKESV
jgi:signal transduction histidine kinase/DNA-binding response OmpR family regulator/sugar lactone lactonase YvrE